MLFVVSVLALFSLASAIQCPPPDSTRYMLPHETDCSKFYKCVHGVPLLQSCPEGTHFSSIFMVCQNPFFAGCSTELPESELECKRNEFQLFKPHPKTCSKFYICVYGVPEVFDCPGGTEFNAVLMECVWPHESNCNIAAPTEAPEDNPDPGAGAPEEGDSQNGGSQDGGSQDGGSQDGGSGCEEGALSAHKD